MTTPSTQRKAGPLLGTGVQTAWPFSFKVFAESDIAVTIADSLGVETALVLNADYSVSLNANQDTSPGGTVTYPLSGSPLAVGSVLSIIGNLEYDQPLDLPPGGNFSPVALENELDRIVMQVQQIKEELNRALRASVTTGADVELPAPESTALIGWNTAADGLQNYQLADLATAVAFATMRYDTFTGDGTTTQFVLQADPATLGNMDVSVDGQTYVPGVDHTLVGQNVVFTVAPSLGAEILVRYGQGVVVAAADAQDVSYLPAGAGAVATDVQTKLRQLVSVKDFGTVGDGVTDDYAAFAAALAASKRVYVPNPSVKYCISRPLVLDDDQQLIGESREACIIEKTTTNLPSPALGAFVSGRAGAVAYDYDKNAIVIIRKPASRSYPNGIGIHNVTLQGKSGVTVEYGVYAPRLSRSRFTDVYINAVTNGWFTYDTFTCVFERVDAWNTSYGFRWENDGSGIGSGTSCTFIGCGANVADVAGWYFYGLVYSSVIGSFSESIVSATAGNRPAAWFFNLCKGLTLSGCGSEVVKGYTFRVSNGSVDVRGGTFTGLTGDTFGTTTGTVYLDSGAKVSIGGGARFEAVTSAGNIYNEYVTGTGSRLEWDGTCTRPSGGAAATMAASGAIIDPSSPTAFTPTVIGSTSAGTATYSVQEGYACRVGNIEYYTATLTWTGGTGTGNLYIGGLPSTAKNTTAYAQGNVQPGSSLTVSAGKVAACQVIPNTQNIRIIEQPVATGSVTLVAYQAAGTITVTGWHFV